MGPPPTGASASSEGGGDQSGGQTRTVKLPPVLIKPPGSIPFRSRDDDDDFPTPDLPFLRSSHQSRSRERALTESPTERVSGRRFEEIRGAVRELSPGEIGAFRERGGFQDKEGSREKDRFRERKDRSLPKDGSQERNGSQEEDGFQKRDGSQAGNDSQAGGGSQEEEDGFPEKDGSQTGDDSQENDGSQAGDGSQEKDGIWAADGSKTSSIEAAFLRDLPFTLQGLSTTYLKFTSSSKLTIPAGLPSPLIYLLHTLAEPSLLYRDLSKAVQRPVEGLIAQSLTSAIGNELRSYLALVATLEGEIRRSVKTLDAGDRRGNVGRVGVTLKRCVVWTRDATMGLRLMSMMAEGIKSLSNSWVSSDILC